MKQEQKLRNACNTALQRLTLIIPSFERREYMLRAMRYWSKIGPQVHVMDGSRVPLSDAELVGVHDNVHYHHLPIGFLDRLKCAIPYIQTEFCALIGDDEFYLPPGVAAAIAHLDANPDVVACGGRVVRFWNFGNEIFWREDYEKFVGYSITSPDAEERMIEHMAHYTPSTIYAVARVEAWKNTVSLMTHKEYAAYALGELQFELAMAYQGNSLVLNEPFWLRSSENEGVRGTDLSLMPEKSFEFWWDSAETVSEKREMLSSMAAHFVAWRGGDKAKIERVIELAFDGYRHRSLTSTSNPALLVRVFRALKWRVVRVLFPRSYEPGGVWRRLDALTGDFIPPMSTQSSKNLAEIKQLLMQFHYGD